ncbi:MAG: hybrid sensor histidine kinase/response regulator [Gemmatimonadaceae bacterium]
MIAGALRRSLALRLSAAFLTLSVGTVLLATFVSFRDAEQTLQQRVIERLATSAAEDAAQLAAWHHRQRAAIEVMAGMAGTRAAWLRPAGAGDGNRSMTLVDQSLLAATSITLLTVPGGRVIRASDAALLDTYEVDQLYYREGRERTFTQSVYPSGVTGRPTMTVATPVRGADGSANAVLAAHLDLTHMQRVLEKPAGEVPIDAYVVNRFAEFVSADRFGSAEHLRGVHSLAIDRALAGETGAGVYTDFRGRPVIGAWRWLPELELGLVLESPQGEAFAPARRLLRNALLTGLIAATLLTFGVTAISRRALRPVIAVTASAEAVTRGDFTATAPVEGVDEVGRLATVFNEMTRRLQANRALLQDVVDNSTTIVVVVDTEHRILLANRRYEWVVDRAPGSLVGTPLADALPEGAARILADVLAKSGRDVTHAECEVTLGTAEDPHTWQAVAFPLRAADDTPYAFGLVATDLTERARAEEERRHRDASVQQAQKLESLGIMAGGIAHDFNNILGAVLGNVDLARTALDDPDEVRIALEQIAAATRRAAELTRQMLAYAGRASLRSEATDLRPVLHDMVALVRAAHSKMITFDIAPMETPLWVGIDPAQLSQVALNLLTNAAEAIGERQGLIKLRAAPGAPRASVEPRKEPDAGWVHLRVSDTGSGISDEVRRRIFDPFFSTKAAGRGLGLSAVIGIIRSTGGVLELESAPGLETTFDVYFPAVAAPAVPAVAAAAAAPSGRLGTILVVDDEPALRRICRRTLEPAGFHVIEAADGIACLDVCRARGEEIDLIVLDLTMPRMGGAEVLAILRAERPGLRVVIASGYDRADRRGDLPSDDNVRFLQKPFDTATLLGAVTSLLDGGMPPRGAQSPSLHSRRTS